MAKRREDLYSDIMSASRCDARLFYRLVNKQRQSQTGAATTVLEYKGKVFHETDIPTGWATYFSDLSTPCSKPEFDSDFYNMVNRDLEIYNEMADIGSQDLDPFGCSEVGICIRRLNNNKAADKFGLTSEHLKFAEENVIPYLTELLNGVLHTGLIPSVFKEGVLTPLLKKLKLPRKLPTNYRGITIICVLGKVLEFLLILRVGHIMRKAQNGLQRGFTSKVAPIYAALILLEVIGEYKDKGDNLTVVMLDAEKAFDRVWHQGLFRRMHTIGIPAHWIGLVQDWYRGFRSQVRWGNQISPSFPLHQGTIQGSGISPELFKIVNNPVLDAVTERHLGAKIGTVCCAVPTCADDMAVLAPSSAAEDVLALQVVIDQLNLNRISINAKKTEVLHYQFSKYQSGAPLEANGLPLEESESAVHLGISHSTDSNINCKRVDGRITSATRTLYALVGAGMHGRNGLNPIVCRSLWCTYVIPVLLYGAELWTLDPKQIQRLETFQLGKLRHIQNLPERTANIAVLGLIGLRPVEAELDIRILGLFRRLIENKESVEYKVAQRQLALKSSSSKSWFMYVDRILDKYGLPSAHELMETETSVSAWKKLVKSVVDTYWEGKLCTQANKSSIRYLSGHTLGLRAPALIWVSSRNTPREAQKARIKVKVMCGVLRLRVHDHLWSKGKSNEVPPTCLMCSLEAENRAHFLLRCPALQDIRDEHLVKIKETVRETVGDIPIPEETMMQLLLDPTHRSCQALTQGDEEILEYLEATSREVIFQLYRRRGDLLDFRASYKPRKVTKQPRRGRTSLTGRYNKR
jgi:hypothetical protein